MRPATMSLRLLVTLLSTLLLGVMTLAPVRASQSTDDKVFLISTSYGSNWQWSADSTMFSFLSSLSSSVDVDMPTTDWYSYNFSTQDLHSHLRWPLYPINFPGIFSSSTTTMPSFAFVSSSGRYVIFANRNPGFLYDLSIGDTALGSVKDIDASVSNPYSGTEYFDVLWSQTENSTLISSTTDNATLYIQYVTELDKPEAEIQSETYFSFPIDDGSQYLITRAFDISDDGDKVLFLTWLDLPRTASQEYGDKYLLTAKSDIMGSLVIDHLVVSNDIRAAAFSPDDESHLLILNAQGLIDLNTATDTINVLEPASTFGNIGRGWFSPNAEWLVFQGDGGLYGYHVLID
jgi:hypothetical protein